MSRLKQSLIAAVAATVVVAGVGVAVAQSSGGAQGSTAGTGATATDGPNKSTFPIVRNDTMASAPATGATRPMMRTRTASRPSMPAPRADRN